MGIVGNRIMTIYCRGKAAAIVGLNDLKSKRRFVGAVSDRRVRVTGLWLVAGMSLTACSGKPADAVLMSKHCWIETINGQGGNSVQATQGPLTIGGWAADSTTGRVPEIMALQMLDTKGNAVSIYPIEKRLARPDVALVLKQPGYDKSGFDVVINSTKADLLAGEYGVSIAMRRDSAVIVCESTKKILIK